MVNYSAGGSGYSLPFYEALVAARDAGVLFVAAAGNDGVDNDVTPHYPSSYDLENVIAVASTDHNDLLSSFSNWGPSSVDLGAPGSEIFSTIPPLVPLFVEDFQTAVPPDMGGLFTLEGPVNYWGTVDVGDGEIVARGDAEESYPYRPYSDGWIVTPAYDTTDLRGLSLWTHFRYETETGDDALIGQVWDGTSWLDKLVRTSDTWPDIAWVSVIELEGLRNPAMRIRFGWQTDGDNNDFFGAEIYSVVARYIGADYTSETAYVLKSGTSMATPHVAGVAALLLASDPDLCLRGLKGRLLWTGDPVAALERITVSERRLNAYNALTAPDNLVVIRPNGGEYWVAGTTRTIGWSVFDCGAPDFADIYLLKGGIVDSQIAAGVPNTGAGFASG